MRISDWSSDVCSSDLYPAPARRCAWPYRIGRGRPCNKKQKYAVGILCLSRLSGGATPGGNPVLRVARGLPLHRVTQGMGMATTEQSTADTHAETGVRRRDFINIARSEEHTSELQSLMRISYAVFCLKKKKTPYYT